MNTEYVTREHKGLKLCSYYSILVELIKILFAIGTVLASGGEQLTDRYASLEWLPLEQKLASELYGFLFWR